MEGLLMTLFAAALYFGWLWNNCGASEYRQLLASISFLERVIRRRALKPRILKRINRRSQNHRRPEALPLRELGYFCIRNAHQAEFRDRGAAGLDDTQRPCFGKAGPCVTEVERR